MLEAEFERDAAEYQRQQHHQDREIKRGNDDRESKLKGREQAESAENEPGLVAVPDRGDRIHYRRARGVAPHEAVKHADAEIEAVKHDVVKDGEPEQDGPEWYKIERHRMLRHSCGAARAALSNGSCGRPL